MALAKQVVPMPLGLGLDTKVDDRQAVFGKLEVAENVTYEDIGKLRKRSGYDKLSGEVTTGAFLENVKRLDKFKEELLAFSPGQLYSYSESIDRWTEKGPVYGVFAESVPIVRNNREQSQLDCQVAENLKIIVWLDSGGDIRYSVQDITTESFLVSNEQVSASGDRPRIAVIQNFVYILYRDTADIKYKRFNVLNPSNLETEVTLQSDLDSSNPIYDVESTANKFYVVYNSSVVASKLSIFSVDSSETASSITRLVGQDADNAISVTTDALSQLLVVYADASSVSYTVFPANLVASFFAPVTIESISDITTVTGVATSISTFKIFYEQSATSSTDHLIKTAEANLAGSITSAASVYARGVGLASKAFQFNFNPYVTVLHDSTLQASYFVLDSNGTVVTKISAGLGGVHIAHGMLPQAVSFETGKFIITTQIKGRTISQDNSFYSLLGVNSSIIDFDETNPFQTAEQGDNLHISGGVLQMYDGDNIVEHGFHLFPENLTAGATNTTGGFLSDGTRSYIAVYSWTDNYGQQHRSAPSIAEQVVLSGGTSTQIQVITAPSLRLTQKENVVIEFYRTEDAGTTFYKITEVSAAVFNDKTVDSVSFTDTVSDADLIDNEVLYTTGGILDNIAAPSSRILVATDNRVALAGLEDRNELSFSKIRNDGLPVEFTDIITRPVPPIGGDITQLFFMDEKLIIFEESAILYQSGGGPNNLGEQDTFSDIELVSGTIGCIDPDSVVLIDSGIIFKSRKGVYLLTRGLQLTYLGDEVEDFNNLTITDAKIVPDLNQVIFLTSGEVALMYNFNLDKWSVYTNHGGQSGAVLDDDYFYLRENNDIFVRSKNSYSDNGIPIKMRIETTWLSFNKIQGYQRVYKLLLLGTYKTEHDLLVKVAYDFEEAFTQQKLIDTDSFVDKTAYGESTPYGQEAKYGGSGTKYQPRLALKRQKCQSLKIRIEDVQGTAGEGLEISSISFLVGGKQGLNKPNIGAKFGTE